MSISLWGLLSRLWLGRPADATRNLPQLDLETLPQYMKRDLGLTGHGNFSCLNPSDIGRFPRLSDVRSGARSL